MNSLGTAVNHAQM